MLYLLWTPEKKNGTQTTTIIINPNNTSTTISHHCSTMFFNPRFPKTLNGCFVGTNGSAVVPKRCLAPEKGLKSQVYGTSYHGLVWQQPFL